MQWYPAYIKRIGNFYALFLLSSFSNFLESLTKPYVQVILHAIAKFFLKTDL